ncbi:MAG TPA: response regulator [Candidatus Eisenbacteria bacterium]
MRPKPPVDFGTPIGLRELLEATPDALFCCDPYGRFQWLNSAIETLSGHPLVELLGRPFTALVDREAHGAVARFYLRQKRRRLPVTEHSWKLRLRDGSEMPVSVRVRRYERLDGEIAFVGCMRAVTTAALAASVTPPAGDGDEPPRRAPSRGSRPDDPLASVAQGPPAASQDFEARLGQLSSEFEAARADVRFKTELLRTLAQEIRPPVNSILGMTHLLLDSNLEVDQRGLLEAIRSSSQGLVTMVHDTVDFSMLQAGICHIDSIDFDLRVTAHEVAVMVAPFAQDKGLRFDYQVNHEVPSRLRGDPGRLRQVLFSLAAGVIRFTSNGGVRLVVDRQGEDGRHVGLTFTVAYGAGSLTDAQRAELIQTFTRGELSPASALDGAARGLSIARTLVKLMGGEVGIEAPEGRGPSLRFHLRLEKQAAPRAPEEAPQVQLRGLRILVVDPSPGARQSAAEMLAAWGCRTDQVGEGEAALVRLREGAVAGDSYRVVTVDLQLSDMDGLELARQVRADPGLGDTLLVLLPSLGNRGDAARAQGAGFAAYLPKPVGWSELYDALVEVVRRGQTPVDGPPVSIITRHSLADGRRARVRVLLVDGDIVNQLVAKSVLSRTGFHVDVAQSGPEAIEACERRRYDLILMDLQMADLDGYTTATAMRARERGHRTPIVAMSSHTGPGARERCIETGMDDYLPKPIDLAELCALVEGWTVGAANWEPANRTEPAAAPRGRPAITAVVGPDVSPPVLDIARLEESCLGIAELRESLLQAFLRDVRPRLERLSAAANADDGRRLHFEAHGLRGMCLTIGTSACARVFGELETLGREGRLGEVKRMIQRAEAEIDRAEREIEAYRLRLSEAGSSGEESEPKAA